jgi:RimJ/RimL family protein N-acetyltransferase
VTVHRSNVPANTFYARLGYQQVGEFRLHRRDWNLYTFGPS